MMIALRPGLLLASLALIGGVGGAHAHPPSRHRHQRSVRTRHHAAPARTASGPAAYGYSARHPYGTLTGGDGQPTCYYADGTPYDPDIIGGVNHVGAGGPAVNWNGFDPCAY